MKKSIGAVTIVFPTPVFVVGTFDKSGKPNVMAAAWGGICCSKPPCVNISLREATYTHSSILEQKAFTISIPSEKYMKEADYFGIVSGKTNDKFTGSGLNYVKSDIVNAPYVKEFPFVLECALLQHLKIGLHTMFIGEIKDVKIDDDMLNSEGKPEIKKINPLIYDPATRKYYAIGENLGSAFSAGKEVGGKP
ncbi:MAG: flavoredoxin [Elusimicrobia bacterium RIFOXYA2_FULL_39_19]|nr:MAG: flavoredoxin [Elusimicrobia bacterium RIFOXYA2_FULL_39_19]